MFDSMETQKSTAFPAHFRIDRARLQPEKPPSAPPTAPTEFRGDLYDAAQPFPESGFRALKGPFFGTKKPLFFLLLLSLLVIGGGLLGNLYFSLEATQSALRQTEVHLKKAEKLIEERDTRLTALQKDTSSKISSLRTELANVLVEYDRRFDNREEGLLKTLSARIEDALGADLAFEKAYLAGGKAAVFIRTDFGVRNLVTGQVETFTAFGSGFLISPDGIGMTAQHVLFPWHYNKPLKVLLKAGMAQVLEDTLAVTMWMTGVTVSGGPDREGLVLGEGVFQLKNRSRGIRILYRADLEETLELISTALGEVEISVPKLGKSDIAIFQIMEPSRKFPFVSIAPSNPVVSPLDEVLVVGYPLSRLQEGKAIPQPSRGRVRRVTPEILELEAAFHPGISGGPIFNSKGEVIGLASAILDSPVYGVAVGLAQIRAALMAARDVVRAEQERLVATGCYRGAIDGIPGPATQAAIRCSEKTLALHE